MKKDIIAIESEETNILIELDNIAAILRDELETIDSIRALTVSILQKRIYDSIAQ